MQRPALGGKPIGMLSPIATVVFSKLRHLGQSAIREPLLRPVLPASIPCAIKALLILFGRSLRAWRLLFNYPFERRRTEAPDVF